MPGPTLSRVALRDTLRARLTDAPLDVAAALAEHADASTLALLANDRSLSARARTIALLALALVLARDPSSAVPDAALDALDDQTLVTAAIDLGLGAALTGILAAAPRTQMHRLTRLQVGRRLAAAGERGPHVTQVLLDAEDRDRAAEVAAADLLSHLGTTPDCHVRLHLVVRWSADEEFFSRVIQKIATIDPHAPDTLLELLQKLPTEDPAGVARARAAIGWAVALGDLPRS